MLVIYGILSLGLTIFCLHKLIVDEYEDKTPRFIERYLKDNKSEV